MEPGLKKSGLGQGAMARPSTTCLENAVCFCNISEPEAGRIQALIVRSGPGNTGAMVGISLVLLEMM